MQTLATEKRLMGKTALVTGASRGIGRAIVERFVAEGIEFVGVHYSRDVDAALEVVTLVEAAGAKAVALQADFSIDGFNAAHALWQAYQEAVKPYRDNGSVDILVNSAGVLARVGLDQTSAAHYAETLSVNFGATFALIQAASPHISTGGRIINVSTSLTRIAAPGMPLYAASKGAIDTLTLALAPEMGTRKITINAVAPGAIFTDMNGHWHTDFENKSMMAASSVFGRVGETRDVADVALFLASNDSGWITGQVIDVSGGGRL